MNDDPVSRLERTKTLLAKHHRQGEHFAQLMKDTFDGRFNDEFWQRWNSIVVPVLSENPVVLDLGTGPGTFLAAVAARHPGVRAVGVECADYMLAAAGDLPQGCEMIAADLHDPHLPLADNSVDVAVASMVLHEMHQPVRSLQEVFRCLKPGGIFYVQDWVRAPLKQYLDNSERDVFDESTSVAELEDVFVHFIEHNRFSSDDLVFLLEKTGFQVSEQTPLVDGRHACIIGKK